MDHAHGLLHHSSYTMEQNIAAFLLTHAIQNAQVCCWQLQSLLQSRECSQHQQQPNLGTKVIWDHPAAQQSAYPCTCFAKWLLSS